MSDDTAKHIDDEVRSIVDSAYSKASKILKDNIDKMHTMSEALMMYETIDKDQIDDIMSGIKPRPPKDWDDKDGKGNNSNSDNVTTTPEFSDPSSNPQ